MRRVILEGYNHYAANVLDPRAGSVQRVETRMAFYAGAIVARSLFQSLIEMGDAEAMKLLMEIDMDFAAFSKEAEAGGASQ